MKMTSLNKKEIQGTKGTHLLSPQKAHAIGKKMVPASWFVWPPTLRLVGREAGRLAGTQKFKSH